MKTWLQSIFSWKTSLKKGFDKVDPSIEIPDKTLHYYEFTPDRDLTPEEMSFLWVSFIKNQNMRFGIEMPNIAPASMRGMFTGVYR